jgi:hypothetical protein
MARLVYSLVVDEMRERPYRNSENSKANRIETMKGPAESGQIVRWVEEK